jgi:hypothetical protein
VAAAGVSFFLALAGTVFEQSFGISTPGTLAARAWVPINNRSPHEFEGIGEIARTQILVDWLFWFAVLYAAYKIYMRIGRKSGTPK